MKKMTAQEIAGLVNGELRGDPDVIVTGVESLIAARAADVSFLGNPRYEPQVLPSKAGVVLVGRDFGAAVPANRAWVLCDNPSEAFTRLVLFFAPPEITFPAGIHAAAVVADSARVPASASIGPHAVIEAEAEIGEMTIIGAGCYVGHKATVGAGCHLYPNVTVRERCVIGDRVIIHSGTVVGSDGFGYIPGENGHAKIPQVGIVQIDDDVEIGAQCAIDRARFGKTWIQRGTKIDNLVQVAHNVVIGELCLIVAQVGIAGSTSLGRRVIAAGQAGIAGHLHIGDGATLMAQAGVSKDIPAGANVVGSPAIDRKEFARNLFAVNRISDLSRKVKELEARLAARENDDAGQA
jgi:UDP-3-O-[3-hydroxymyristoyl] glucosamine N-acyltransferase